MGGPVDGLPAVLVPDQPIPGAEPERSHGINEQGADDLVGVEAHRESPPGSSAPDTGRREVLEEAVAAGYEQSPLAILRDLRRRVPADLLLRPILNDAFALHLDQPVRNTEPEPMLTVRKSCPW